MSGENYKAIIRRWVEGGWNQGNLALVDELYASNYTIHDPTVPSPPVGHEAFKQYITTLRTALPDIHFTIEDFVVEGDMVVWRFTARGTQSGELMGIPPTGKSATVAGLVMSRFENGKWAEDYVNWDAFGMLQQIGAIPAPAQ